jgi:hypothetical protein
LFSLSSFMLLLLVLLETGGIALAAFLGSILPR